MLPRRPLRIALSALAALVVAAAIGFGVLIATFDPNAYKPRIVTAVRAATGRDLALNGAIQLAFLPRPGITLHDVVLANPPGFSGPPLATVHQITLRIELGALLHRRVVVRELVLDRPEIALERNAAGVPNWRFSAPAPHPAAAVQQPAPEHAGSQAGFAVLDARIRDGGLTYRDDRTGQTQSLTVPHLAITAASPDAPAHLAGDAVLADTRLALQADTGPLTGLSGGDLWPVKAGVTAERDGLHVALDLAAPAADKPIGATTQGTWRGVAFTATAEFGAPSLLSGASPTPYPVSLDAQAAGARLAAQGTVAQPARLAGADLALSAHVPDLAALSSLAGRPLPALRSLTATARLSDPGGPLTGLVLRDLRLTAAPGDLAGSADIAFAPRPSLRATLAGSRLDLSVLRRPTPPPPLPVAKPPAPPRAPTPTPVGHVIPDTPIPFAALRVADADVRLTVAAVRAGADTWRKADAHVALAGGVLAVSAHGLLGALPTALTFTADARADPAVVALALNAPALPLAPLLTAAGQRPFAAGNLAISAELRGAGNTPHAIAAGLDGFLAASMTGGTIETRILERALGPVIARANPLGLLGGGQSDIRCLALRLTAKHGKAELAPLLLSSPLITVDGSGQLDLAAETLDLHLQPQGRAGGVAFAVPVSVRGGFRAPRIAVADASAATAGLRAALGLFAGKGLGQAGASSGPSCPDALAAARR